MGDTATICQTFIPSTRHTAYHSPNCYLMEPVPLQPMWSTVYDVQAHVSLSCPRRVQWRKGLGPLLTMTSTYVVLLEVSIDDSCTLSMGIVVLKNKTSIHTPSQRDDKSIMKNCIMTLACGSFLRRQNRGERDVAPW